MDRVRVVHHRDTLVQANGVTLKALDAAGDEVLRYAFHSVRDDSPEVVDVDVFGRARCWY